MNTVEKITKLIKNKGITEKKFLEDIGLGKNKLGEWRNGTTKSYRDYIVEIADYFGVTTDYLLRDDEQQSFSLIKTEEKKMGKRYINEKKLASGLEICLKDVFLYGTEKNYQEKNTIENKDKINLERKENKEKLNFLSKEINISIKRINGFVNLCNGNGTKEDYPSTEEFGKIRLYTGKFNETQEIYDMLLFEEEKYVENLSNEDTIETENPTGT